MNVYDFDNTIYEGDSTIDFYLFCIKHHSLILFYFPQQVFYGCLYLINRIDKTKFKEHFYCFLQGLSDVDEDVISFWNSHESKIKFWYIKQMKEDDVIISASPDFLLIEICRRLGIKGLIASRVDKKNGTYNGQNCYGEEKVRRLISYSGDSEIECFYSDSKSDEPLARKAQKAYLVNGNVVSTWDLY